MTLFADRTYALVTVASFVFGIALSLMFLSSFLFLLGIWGYAQGLTGLAVTPGPLGVIAVAVASGRLAGRVGHRAVPVAGGILYAGAQGWVALQVTETPACLTLWFPVQILGGIAVGLLLVGLSGAAVAQLPPARFGVGGAVNNAVRQLGGVFGTALAVVLVGQTGAGPKAFRAAFLCLGLIGLAVAALCLPLSRQSGRAVRQTAT
jgi:MFS family permease